jgi:uncharacterized protein YjbI with pentapeptide repeats
MVNGILPNSNPTPPAGINPVRRVTVKQVDERLRRLEDTAAEVIKDEKEKCKAELESQIEALAEKIKKFHKVAVVFAILLFYVAATAATTTHRMLFLSSPIKLPVLGFDFPLLVFYVIAPITVLVVQYTVMSQLNDLMASFARFREVLTRFLGQAGRDREELVRETLAQLPFTIFARLHRTNGMPANGHVVDRVLGVALIIVAPTLTILIVQERFLPYHSEIISWFHRILIICAVIVALVRTEWLRRLWRRRSALAMVGQGCVATLVAASVLLPLSLGTFRTEGLGRLIHRGDWPASRFLLYQNVLDLNGERFIDEANAERNYAQRVAFQSGARIPVPALRFSGRDFSGADLSSTDLRFASFIDVNLEDAKLSGIRLDYAQFTNVSIKRAHLTAANLDGAIMERVECQGAEFFLANAVGLFISKSECAASEWLGVNLVGARISESSFVGSNFSGADMRASRWFETDLRGVAMQATQLQLAHLFLINAQAALLESTNLTGARMVAVGLHRTTVTGPRLTAAALARLHLERDHISGGSTEDALNPRLQPMSDAMLSAAIAKVRESNTRVAHHHLIEDAVSRLETLRPTALDRDQRDREFWQLAVAASQSAQHHAGRFEEWKRLFCRTDGWIPGFIALLDHMTDLVGAPAGDANDAASVRGAARRMFEDLQKERDGSTSACFGVRNLPETQWTAVRRMIERDILAPQP